MTRTPPCGPSRRRPGAPTATAASAPSSRGRRRAAAAPRRGGARPGASRWCAGWPRRAARPRPRAAPGAPTPARRAARRCPTCCWSTPAATCDFSAAAPASHRHHRVQAPDDPRNVPSPAVDLFDGDVAAFSWAPRRPRRSWPRCFGRRRGQLHAPQRPRAAPPTCACGEAVEEVDVAQRHSPDNAACEEVLQQAQGRFFHGRDWRGSLRRAVRRRARQWIRWYREGRLKAFDEGGRKVYDTIAGRRRRLGLAA